jgi:Tfp pilus assembly protein PilF
MAYLQAKEINPKDILIHDKLAQIYESEGELNQAAKQYMIGSTTGNVNSLLGLGRVLINENDLYPEWKLSEAYLLMGLQRANADSSTSPYIYYQLNRNMGWLLIQQQQYPAAIQYLEKAITWRKKVKSYSTNGGTGNCFLAYAYEENGQAQQATDNWKKCVQYGKPDYIHEYRWLLTIGKRDVAFCVDTSAIVGGYKGEKPPEVSKQCQQLFNQ